MSFDDFARFSLCALIAIASLGTLRWVLNRWGD